MPLAIVTAVLIGWRRAWRTPWWPTLCAIVLFVVPTGTWAVARWRIDGWIFFDKLLNYDLVARILNVLQEHPGGPLYYLDIVQRSQYDWLVAGVVALMLFPIRWQRVPARLVRLWQGDDTLGILLASWAGMTFLVPTVMRTKLPWYLNPFYPVFALTIAWIRGFLCERFRRTGTNRRDAAARYWEW